MEKVWKKLEKSQKIHFSANFHGWILAFPGLKNVPKGQIWHSLCPQWGILMGKFVSTGFWGRRIQRMGKNWEKSQKIDFSGIPGHFEMQNKWSKSSILVLFKSLVGHWDMQKCFPMFVCVFQAISGVKNDLNQNTSFSLWFYKVNEALNGGAECNP